MNRQIAILVTMLLSLFMANRAMAATDVPAIEPLFDRAEVFTGKTSWTEYLSIENDSMVRLTLTDFEFPNALKHLGVALTSSTEKFADIVLKKHDDRQQSVDFFLPQGTYFLAFFGKTACHLDFGMYGLQLAALGDMHAPLPAAAVLFLSGIGGLLVLRRRSRAAAV